MSGRGAGYPRQNKYEKMVIILCSASPYITLDPKMEAGKTDIASVFRNVPYGTHFCVFNDTEEDLAKVLIPFIKDGLERNDAFIYVASKTRPTSGDALGKGFPDLDRFFRAGQIKVIVDGEEYYTRNIRNPDQVLAEWLGSYDQTLARGFSGLRVIGSPYGEAKRIWHDLLHWENYVNQKIPHRNIILFCHYPIDSIETIDVPALLSSHQFSVFCVEGNLKLFETLEAKQLREALKESEEQFSTLTEASPAGILVTVGDQIVYANPAMVSVTGYSNEEILHLRVGDLLQERGGTTALSGNERENPAPARSEAVLMTGGKGERWVDCSSVQILYRGKQATLITMLDITARKLAEKAVAEARDRAELYCDLMGHDITNLNQIALGFLELALETLDLQGKLERGERELIEKPVVTIEKSSTLIHNIKKLQQQRSGELEPHLLDLAAVLREVVARYSAVPGRDVKINFEASEGCLVQANELLRDVFANLLDNAVKHSTGPLEITVSLSHVSVAEGVFYQVVVEDNGPGIPDSRKRQLLEHLCGRGPEVLRTGFGLCLVDTLIKDFHGQFRMEDRVRGDHRQGARFVVRLPRSAPDLGPSGAVAER